MENASGSSSFQAAISTASSLPLASDHGESSFPCTKILCSRFALIIFNLAFKILCKPQFLLMVMHNLDGTHVLGKIIDYTFNVHKDV